MDEEVLEFIPLAWDDGNRDPWETFSYPRAGGTWDCCKTGRCAGDLSVAYCLAVVYGCAALHGADLSATVQPINTAFEGRAYTPTSSLSNDSGVWMKEVGGGMRLFSSDGDDEEEEWKRAMELVREQVPELKLLSVAYLIRRPVGEASAQERKWAAFQTVRANNIVTTLEHPYVTVAPGVDFRAWAQKNKFTYLTTVNTGED